MSFDFQYRFPLKLYCLTVLIVMHFSNPMSAQDLTRELYSKISPLVHHGLQGANPDSLINLQVVTTQISSLSDSVESLPGVEVTGIYTPIKMISLLTPVRWISRIAGWSHTLFVDLKRTARPELFTGTMDGSVNRLNMLRQQVPLLNGNSVTIGIKENSFDTTDIDYRGRVKINPSASVANNSHGSIMATIAAGAGTSWYAARGAAWGSHLVSSPFDNLLPDAPSFFQNYDVTVQNHSYGTGIENFYGPEAMAYDQDVFANASRVHIFSSGNSGDQASANGAYSGIAGYANLTGQFKMAKNIITVGATDSFWTPAPLSSRGPAYDGRIKPELVALGEDGSSGAAAITSGVAAVLQDAYRSLTGGNLPPASLIRAFLVNGADDIGIPGPDYRTGFGSLNAKESLASLLAGEYTLGSVTPGQERTQTVSIPSGVKKFKISLAWTDPPAAVNAGVALVNDLDLSIEAPGGGSVFLPWGLRSFPHPDSLSLPATRKRDGVNNIEQVTIDNPVPGIYLVRVRGTTVTTTQQEYSMVWQLELSDRFEWNYPMRDDPLLGGQPNVLRWKSSLATGSGTLQYSVDNGNNWQLIQSAVDLATGYYLWNVPDLFSPCLVRMVAGNNFDTDTVMISKRLPLSVGFNCADSFQLFWAPVPGADSYRLYRLGTRYLEAVNTLTDTSVVLQKASNPDLFYALAPVKSGREGVKTYTLNYTLQGAACYFRSFYVDQQSGTARVQLELSSLYNIRRLILVRYTGNDSVILQDLNNPVSLRYLFSDPGLRTGITSYRVYLVLVTGSRLASDRISILYSAEDRILVYPNPVRIGQVVSVLLNDNQNGELQVFDSWGRKTRVIPFSNGGILELETASLPPGVYLLKLAGHTRSVKTGKLVVY